MSRVGAGQCTPAVSSVSATAPNASNQSTITVTLTSATTTDCYVSIACSPSSKFTNAPTEVNISANSKQGNVQATLVSNYGGGASVSAGGRVAAIPS